jgi:hypothetical protein
MSVGKRAATVAAVAVAAALAYVVKKHREQNDFLTLKEFVAVAPKVIMSITSRVSCVVIHRMHPV